MAWSDRDSPKCNQLLTTVGLSVGLHVTTVFNQSNILTKDDEQVQYFIKIPNPLTVSLTANKFDTNNDKIHE